VRRKPVTLSERLRAFFWPRKGLTRAPRYIALRILRLNSSPHSIAVGVAAGAASSLTPFFGLHIVLAVLLASAFSGNLIAAAITTLLANPITIPVILTASYEVGTMITQPQAAQVIGGQEIMRMVEHLDLASLWGPVFKPMLIGSLPLSAAGALIFYPACLSDGPPLSGAAPAGPLAQIRTSDMIIGIGSDLIDIRRIENSLQRFGERFVNRCFTDIEIAKSEGRKNRAASYAKRFAAKEACSKALGTGLAQGVFWKDMGVVNLPGGKPTMQLTGGAAARLQEMLPVGHRAAIHLTITDDFPLAQAFVIIEALPVAPAEGTV
jgi:holo-[acyl-carrier-protein] synthase